MTIWKPALGGAIAALLLMATPLAAQDAAYTTTLDVPGGGTLEALVTSENPDRLNVEIDGTVYGVAVEAGPERAAVTVRNADGKVLARAESDTTRTLLTDTRGNSVEGTGGRVLGDRAGQLFDRILLTLLEGGNLDRIRRQPMSIRPGLTYGTPPLPDLCCDAGSVSNCFPPGEDGCGADQDLVACPAGNCEINGTWNCC